MNEPNRIDENTSRGYLPDREEMEQDRISRNATKRRTELRRMHKEMETEVKQDMVLVILAILFVGGLIYFTSRHFTH